MPGVEFFSTLSKYVDRHIADPSCIPDTSNISHYCDTHARILSSLPAHSRRVANALSAPAVLAVVAVGERAD